MGGPPLTLPRPSVSHLEPTPPFLLSPAGVWGRSQGCQPPCASPVPPLGPPNPSSTSLLSPAGALGGRSTVTPPHPPVTPHTVSCCPHHPLQGFWGGPTDATPLSLHPQTLEDTREGGASQCPPQPLPSDWGACFHPCVPPTPQEGDHTRLTRKVTNSLHLYIHGIDQDGGHRGTPEGPWGHPTHTTQGLLEVPKLSPWAWEGTWGHQEGSWGHSHP